MGLGFILGHGNCDHQTRVVDEALAWRSKSAGRKVFFLVPNFNKFMQEQELLQAVKQRSGIVDFSTIDIQVFSFYRLAWYFLQQTGALSENTISDVGSGMLLRKILSEMEEELTVFKSEIRKKGFIRQLLDLNTELAAGNLTPAELLSTPKDEFLTQLSDAEAVKWQDQQEKLAEIAKILDRYQNALVLRQLQTEDPLALLTDFLKGQWEGKIVEAPDLTDTLFVAYGFEELYAKELQLLQVLAEKAELTVALMLDRQYTTEKPAQLDLFYSTGKIFYQLTQAARLAGETVRVLEPAQDCTRYPNLEELEGFWRLTQNQGRYQPAFDLSEQVHLWRTVTPEEELRQIAAEIRRLLVADPTLRLKDIQLVTNDLETYGQLIPHIFQEADLPLYIDQKATMEQHPLVEFLRALLELETYHFRLEDILRLLKSELILPAVYLEPSAKTAKGSVSEKEAFRVTRRQQAVAVFRRDVDLTENLALKNNLQGYQWLAKEDWPVVEYDFENQERLESGPLTIRSNRLRRSFRDLVGIFFKKLKASADGRTAVTHLYHFLLEAGVEETLLSWRDKEVSQGALEQARNHEQTWQALMTLMDEYVQIYGEDPFDLEVFTEVFTTGLETSAYGRIPAAIDQIQVNQLTLTRPRQCRITFAIGLNESNFPQQSSNHSLLTDEERERLNQVLPEDKFIQEGTRGQAARSPLIAYKLFLSATDQLYLSYAANQDTQQNIKMSPYVRRFVSQLGLGIDERRLLTPQETPDPFVASYRMLVGQLNNLYRQCEDEKMNIPYLWQRLEQAVKASPEKEVALRAFFGRSRQNVPLPLDPALAETIYGKDLYASVSRLESFYECEYRYFSEYGLRLKERELYGIDTMMTGSLFHDALDRFLKAISELSVDLAELSDEKRQLLLEELLQEILGEAQYSVLESTARMRYLRYRLGKTVEKVTWALHKQSQKTRLYPVKTEVLFGQIAGKKGIPGIELPLDNGGQLRVRGKIDRVDVAQQDDQTWLAVVDYKSGDKQFSLVEAYYGLAMQLITYLDVALMDAKELVGTEAVRPAGAYYMRVHDPVLSPQEAENDRLLEKFKMKGFYLKDGELYQQMDDSPGPKETSQLFPINRDAKGILKNTPQTKTFYTEAEIDTMRRYNREKMKSAGDKIVSGEIALNPYLTASGKRACTYCPFRSLCGFDVMLKENDYHRLVSQDKEHLLDEMKGAVEDDETNQ